MSVTNSRRWPRVAGTVLAVLLAMLPVTLVAVAIVRESGPTGPDHAEARSLFESRGREVAAAWQAIPSDVQRGGFVPLQALTVEPAGIPEPLDIFMFNVAYWLRTEPPSQPTQGQVRFADGESMAVPLAPARQAFSEINKGACPADRPLLEPGQPDPSGNACYALPVTDVRLGEVPVQTTRGPATVPGWLFTVPGLPAPVARVAVSPEGITERPEPALALMSSRLETVVHGPMVVDHVDGATVHFWFDKACDQVVGAVAYETADVVVLGVQVEPPRRGTTCPAVIVPSQISVTLAAPVGHRLLLGTDGVLRDYVTPREREKLADPQLGGR